MASKDGGFPDSVVEIDVLRLDEEWLRQPKTFKKYAERLADAKLEYGEQKAQLDVVKAEVEIEIRQDPEAHGIAKVTEGLITSLVTAHPRVQKQTSWTLQTKHMVDSLEAVVNALEHRKRALENLVTLHGQDYFSAPRAKGTTGQKMREMESKSARGRAKFSKD